MVCLSSRLSHADTKTGGVRPQALGGRVIKERIGVVPLKIVSSLIFIGDILFQTGDESSVNMLW